ncbi:hypothetical protein [Aquipuribacter sp. SD81]|uniref:hypothetical protein n=1 Tax=Aquipuribacter sp. SD81 TaxID=3127703 RepID=UPI003018251A
MDVPWLRDSCPPAPFVSGGLADGLAAPAPLVEVLPGVLAAAAPGWADGRAGAAPRARALAWATGLRSGVVLRLAAAWVWTGDGGLLPRRVRAAAAPARPLSSQAPAAASDRLRLLPTRWCGSADWCDVGGVGVTRPATTAAECLRLEPAPAAESAVRALLGAGVVDLDAVRAALLGAAGARSRTTALARLDALGQSPATSRCTPLVTR